MIAPAFSGKFTFNSSNSSQGYSAYLSLPNDIQNDSNFIHGNAFFNLDVYDAVFARALDKKGVNLNEVTYSPCTPGLFTLKKAQA